VVRRLGRNPFGEPSRIFIEAAVSHDEGVWRAEIEMRDADGSPLGSRQVQSDGLHCASLASAAGLAIALMIDPDAGVVRPPPPAPRLHAPTQMPPEAPKVRPVRASARRGELLASLVGASRVLPRPALGARLAGDLRLIGRLDATLSLAFLPERRTLERGQQVSFGLFWGAVGPCYRLVDSSSVTLSSCAAFLLGALRTVVFDPGRARASQFVWAGAALGLRVGLSPLAGLRLEGGVDLMTPFYRRDYLVETAPAQNVLVFSDPSLAGSGFIGLGVQY
jgi:hypothetical protein